MAEYSEIKALIDKVFSAKTLDEREQTREYVQHLGKIGAPVIPILFCSSSKSRDEIDDFLWILSEIATHDSDAIIDEIERRPKATQWLLWALRGITTDRAIDTFLSHLKNRNQYVRDAAVVGLTQAQSPRTIEPLIGVLRDRSHSVKYAAVRALGQFGDERAIPELERIVELPSLQKNSPGIVKKANSAISSIRARAKKVGN